jgi:hypothetical protein
MVGMGWEYMAVGEGTWGKYFKIKWPRLGHAEKSYSIRETLIAAQ